RARRPVSLRPGGRSLRRRRLPRMADDRSRRGRTGQGTARVSCRRDARAVIEILEPGIQTTVQDYPGRRGLLAKGFFPAGPMDHLAFRAANLIVGNPPEAAALEVTLGNFSMRLDGIVAVCGADAPVALNGRDVAMWEAHEGRELRIGPALGPGFRLY